MKGGGLLGGAWEPPDPWKPLNPAEWKGGFIDGNPMLDGKPMKRDPKQVIGLVTDVPLDKRKERYPAFFKYAKGLQSAVLNFAHNFYEGGSQILEEVPLEEANAVSSKIADTDNMHRVVLDIDMEAVLIPSETKGHYHLIIDKALPWEKYTKLLDALADAGIIEKGYADVSKKKGATWIRTPWQKKGFRPFRGGPTLTIPWGGVGSLTEVFPGWVSKYTVTAGPGWPYASQWTVEHKDGHQLMFMTTKVVTPAEVLEKLLTAEKAYQAGVINPSYGAALALKKEKDLAKMKWLESITKGKYNGK